MPHSKMGEILYEWRKWASPDEPQKWVTQLIEAEKGVLSFLVAFLSKTQSHGMGDYVCRTQWRISLKNIEDFIPVDIIQKKIEGLAIEELSEKEQQAVHAFQKAMKRRDEGKPDDGRHINDEDE